MDDAVALYLVVHGARAVADAEDEGAARFLALDIGDRFALIAKDVLDDAAEARGALAEYVFGGGEDVLAGYGLARDRKSTRLTPVTNAHLVCRLLLEKKKKQLY